MVQATLDFDQVSRTIQNFDPESQVALREQNEEERFSGESSLAPGGVPGVDGEEVEVPVEGEDGITYEKTDRTTEFGVDNIVTNEIQAAGAVQELHRLGHTQAQIVGLLPNLDPHQRDVWSSIVGDTIQLGNWWPAARLRALPAGADAECSLRASPKK